ncbi:MAG: hypothetical protein ACK54K_05555, partial [Gemmatimonadaceae bacterium]
MRRLLQTWVGVAAGGMRRAALSVTVALAVVGLPSPGAALWAQEVTGRPAGSLADVRHRIDSLVLRRPAVLGALGRSLLTRPDPAAMAERAVRDAERLRASRLRRDWQRTVQRSFLRPEAAEAQVAVTPATPPVDSGPTPGALVPLAPTRRATGDPAQAATDFLNEIGDLGISLNARLESKVQRSRNERCTAAQLTII